MTENNDEYISLNEACLIILGDGSAEPQFIHDYVASKMLDKWRYARDQFIAEHKFTPPTKMMCSYDDTRRYTTLPFKTGLDYTRAWMPWALSKVKIECDELITKIGSLDNDTIKDGARAPELVEF